MAWPAVPWVTAGVEPQPADGPAGPSPAGWQCIIAARTAMQTVSSRWLRPRCSNVTMPVPGRDRDRRASMTSVTTWMVSPANTGAGRSTREKPRLATVVPRVSSWTDRPTTRPSVNRLFTSGWPNSVLAANSASRWSGWGFMVIVVNSTLSDSVTVRVMACRTRRPGSSCSNHNPAILRAAGLGGGAGDLGVQADVVERAGHDRQGHRRARGAVQVGGGEIAALAGRGRPDD